MSSSEEQDTNTVKQNKRQYKWLKDYQWKPGQSGNPKGRKKGTKSLKVWARDFLEALPDDKKLEFLKEISPDIVWRMGEGNPHQTEESKQEITLPKPLLDVLHNNSYTQNSETEEKD